jgi:predicted esterase
MISRNWLGRSVLACGAVSVLCCGTSWGQARPAIALIDAADAAQWQGWTQNLGWRVIAPAQKETSIDFRVQTLAAAVEEAIKNGSADRSRIYLGGRGNDAASVFYTISRVPDLWAAAVALDGSPVPAIDSDRIFAVNFTNVPVLWVSNGPNDKNIAENLKSKNLNVEWMASAGVSDSAVFDWLAKHRRDEFPAEIDCETNAPAFARCYWIQMTKFDVNERNEVLSSTRLAAASRASLDLGAFSFKLDEPGPGLLITALPEKYSGPLKMNDRIVAIDGRPIADARQYVDIMSKITEEKPAVATVQRGKERVRIETRILMPRRDAVVTARVQAKYDASDKGIQIITRAVKELRVTIPEQWAQGGRLYWNGLSLERIEKPGCVLLTIDRELLHSAPCVN